MKLEFLGAAGEVTGSMYLLRTADHTVLLECGLLQGGPEADDRNREAFPFDIGELDAVILSHAHIDHSGRVPQLARRGYTGPVYTQNATRALCHIMLPDSGYLNEKTAQWDTRKARARGAAPVRPIYTRADAEACLELFEGARYDEPVDVVPGLTLRFHDAGHILGSSIVQLDYEDGGETRRLVFSGDLGYRDAPVMDPPARIDRADTVLLESTYGDRLHRPFADTLEELKSVFHSARASQGNILIPSFTVGRAQDLLFLMAEHYEEWGLDNWQIFLDSPMAIEATDAYARYRHLYDASLFREGTRRPALPNLRTTRSSEDSMGINNIKHGAIVIAGSGMCSGGRILHHLKNNIWRPECHVVIIGFQAYGTLGRRIVDGAEEIRMWGDTYAVRSPIHTIGGLSAHADQSDLIDWYNAFANKPPVYLVHGEPKAQKALAGKLGKLDAPVSIARRGEVIEIPPASA